MDKYIEQLYDIHDEFVRVGYSLNVLGRSTEASENYKVITPEHLYQIRGLAEVLYKSQMDIASRLYEIIDNIEHL